MMLRKHSSFESIGYIRKSTNSKISGIHCARASITDCSIRKCWGEYLANKVGMRENYLKNFIAGLHRESTREAFLVLLNEGNELQPHH